MRKYRRVFENLPLESVMLDPQGFIVEANALARKHFSLHRETTLQRRSVYQLFSLESRGGLHEALNSGNDLARAPHCELAAREDADARQMDAHIIALDPDSPICDERLMVLVDRSFEHRLSVKHEEVSRSEARYRTLFDNSKVPMLLVDPLTGGIVRGNAAALAFYGYDALTLQSMLITDINCLSDEATRAEMHRAATERRAHFYFPHRLANGEVLQVEVHSGPIEMDGRTLLYSIVHDITDRVRAQHRAEASHALLTNLAAQVPGVIYQFQMFPDGRSCFPYASGGIETIYEVSAAQVREDASAVFSRMHPQDLERVSASIAQSHATLAPWVCEYRVLLPVQGERWRSGMAKPERLPDGSTLWHGFITDITDHKIAEEKLEEFNRDFEAFLDQTSDFVYFKDRASRFRFCSQALATICNHSDWRDMRGKHDREVFPQETARVYEREEAPVFANGTPLLNQIDPYFDANGKPGFVHTNKWPLFDQHGQVTGIFGISRDVTESRSNQARLQLAANVFTYAREGILIADAQGLIVEVNAAFTRITGYERAEVIGQNPRFLKSGRQNRAFYQHMWNSLSVLGHWEGEIWNKRKQGGIYAELLSISVVRDSEGKTLNYVSLMSDISLQKAHEQELEHIARYDVLTGLPNRAVLADRLQQEMAHCLRHHKLLAVVFVDLDGFKQVNDLHGHDVGDRLLIALSQRMKAALRDGDTLSRIGGDEFVAVLTGLEQPRDCEIVLTRLLKAAADPVLIHAADICVSASIGVTLFPHDVSDAEQLVRHADHAMYQAKQAGKNRYHYFDVKDDLEVKLHRESLDEVAKALAGEAFVLHYQPKVNMKTGALVGLEALIRWQHPVRGMIFPAGFLPSIKDHPLSIKLGDWVINTAVRQLSAWNAQNLRVSVSVNIDAIHLQQTGFVARLQEILLQHPDVKPQQLELEVLETSALQDMEKVIGIMRECAAMGVRFSLDDFGTGYSSLTYLKRLPAKLMKIDQSFVIGMVQESDDFVIVEGVIGLARAFGRSVLAEGVETVAHGELLLALGCHLGQGFGISRAMPPADVFQWVVRWRPDPAWTVWNTAEDEAGKRAQVLADIKQRHRMRDAENHVSNESVNTHTAQVQRGEASPAP
jgi:diguanylate cyclase (GGDEF)-like protein/PAS domain S-box-containing protein